MKEIVTALLCGCLMAAPVAIGLDACSPTQKVAIRTAADVAVDACKITYGATPEQLPQGVSIEDFCKKSEVIRTFIDSFLGAKMGLSRNPGSYTDAGAK
jgi:hypothetical protein